MIKEIKYKPFAVLPKITVNIKPNHMQTRC